MQEDTKEAGEAGPGTGWRWTHVLSFLAALAAAGSATLHLVGSIWHHTYLAYWGVDAKQFPQSTDQILLTGFYALFERLFLLFRALLEEWYLVLLAVTILFFVIWFVDALTDKLADATAAVARRGPPWRARAILVLVLGVVFTSFAMLATVVLVSLMGVPAAAAEMSARKSAETNAADFAKGCAQSSRDCVEVHRSGQAPIRGYLLESSPSHLAIFEADSQLSRTLARDGAEIVSAKRKKNATPDTAN